MDQDRGIAGETRPQNIKKRINPGILADITKKVEKIGDQHKSYSQRTNDIRNAHNQLINKKKRVLARHSGGPRRAIGYPEGMAESPEGMIEYPEQIIVRGAL